MSTQTHQNNKTREKQRKHNTQHMKKVERKTTHIHFSQTLKQIKENKVNNWKTATKTTENNGKQQKHNKQHMKREGNSTPHTHPNNEQKQPNNEKQPKNNEHTQPKQQQRRNARE